MAKDHSFDIVSKVDLQELKNALQTAQKEIQTRFDFKGTSAGISFEEDPPVIKLTADHGMQLKNVVDVLQGKLVKRGVHLKSFEWKEPEQLPSGGAKQQAVLQQGLTSEKAKDVVKAVKGLGLKVEARIEGDSVRVSARQLDDLQTVIQAVRQKEFGLPLQFENYR